MAQAGFFRRGMTMVPRSLLEVTAASLATFLATSLWYDLPHRGAAPPQIPQAEKLSVQAPPLSLRIHEPTAEDEASRFMEAVALSHVAPLLPEGEINRASVDTAPPPAVQQVQAHAPLQKPKLVAAAVPLPPRQPALRVAAAPATAQPASTAMSGLRPPVDIPTATASSPERGLRIPVVSDLAHSTQKTVSDGIDSLSRGVGSLLRK